MLCMFMCIREMASYYCTPDYFPLLLCMCHALCLHSYMQWGSYSNSYCTPDSFSPFPLHVLACGSMYVM